MYCGTLLIIILLYKATPVTGGECCRAHYDLTFEYNEAEWCSSYCCGTSALGALVCCDNIILQASSYDRTSVCWNFFQQNVWALVLPIVGGVGLFVLCIVCCVCLFKGSSSRGTVVHPNPQPPHTNLVVLPMGGYSGPYQGHAAPAMYPPYQPPAAGSYTSHPPPAVTSGSADQQLTDSKHPFESN